MRLATVIWYVILSLGVSGQVHAVEPSEMLKDPVLEARARAISRVLRCVRCQNQSIDDSDASVAKDLRLLVRERLKKGDTDKQVMAYVVERYGDFVLLEPPVRPETWLLWFGPPLVLVLAGGFIFFRRRRRVEMKVSPLSSEEQSRLIDLQEGREPPQQ